MINQKRQQLLATVANLYYTENKSQAEIAKVTGYSRSAISRLLTEAREKGVVEITINHPLERLLDLEHQIRDKYGLIDVRVARRGTLNYQRTLRLVGKLGANYLHNVFSDNTVLAISWGTAVYEMAQSLPTRSRTGIQVVQMIGSLGYGDPLIDGPEVARTIANILGGQYHTLNAPLIVEDQVSRAALLGERRIRETLNLTAHADYALVGIGSVEKERSSLVRAGYLTYQEMNAIKESGAVGDVCATHYDLEGNILDIDINDRIVGIDLQTLIDSPCIVIGIAIGKVKTPAIIGALRGGIVDILITDSTAAKEILSQQEQPIINKLSSNNQINREKS